MDPQLIYTIYFFVALIGGVIGTFVPYYIKCTEEHILFDKSYLWGLVIVLLGSVAGITFPETLTVQNVILVLFAALGINTTINKINTLRLNGKGTSKQD